MKDYFKNHDTYFLGVAEDIKSSNRIRLYYSNICPISLSNLEQVFNNNYEHDLSGSDPIYEKTAEGYFLIPSKNGKIKFNTIIYYSNITGKPIGYTLFKHLQETAIDGDNSKIFEIRIFIDFELKGDVLKEEIKILNTLSSLNGDSNNDLFSDLVKKFIDSETPNKYASLSEVKKYFEQTKLKNYQKYTNYLGDLYSDPKYKTLTDSTVILGGNSYLGYQFQLLSGQSLNDYNTDFTKYFVGIYENDLVLYQWSPNSYSYRVVSLTNSNSFNIPKIRIPLRKINKEKVVGYELEYLASNYAVFYNPVSDKWGIYDLLEDDSSNSFRELSQGVGVSINPWENNSTVTFFSKERSSNVLDQFAPESKLYKKLLSLPLDLISGSFQFLGEIGPWVKFEGYGKIRNSIIYSNTNGNIVVSQDEFILPISNRCILSQKIKDNGTTDYEFYFVEKGKTIFSRSYESLSGLIDSSENSEYKIFFNSEYNDDDSQENLERISLIDGLRRKPIISYDLPPKGFLSSFSGILFYELDNKINYL